MPLEQGAQLFQSPSFNPEGPAAPSICWTTDLIEEPFMS